MKNRLLETDDSNKEKRKLTQDQNTQLKASVDLQVWSSVETEEAHPDVKKVNFGGWKMEVDNTNIKPPTHEPPPQILEKPEKKFYLKKDRLKFLRNFSLKKTTKKGRYKTYAYFQPIKEKEARRKETGSEIAR